jgi:hypothetical protein
MEQAMPLDDELSDIRYAPSLQKDLADRLGSISGPIFGDYKPWPKWDLIAAECIRQMEWARNHGYTECAADDCEHCTLHPGPLTIAPEGWNP